MIDMHQGFSGRELEEADDAPTLATVALRQLEAATLLTQGQFRRAARGQLATARLLGTLVARGVRSRLGGK